MLPYRGDLLPLGELIRARRRQLGLSQSDVAEAIGMFDRPTVTRQEVARWERGKRIPRGHTGKAIAFALEVPVGLLDRAAAIERDRRSGISGAGTNRRTPVTGRMQANAVHAIRAALLDYGGSGFAVVSGDDADEQPEPGELRGGLADVMASYQASRYSDMLVHLPEVLSGAHLAVNANGGERRHDHRVLALACQAAAMC